MLEWTLQTGRTYVAVTDPIEPSDDKCRQEFDQELMDMMDPWIDIPQPSVEELKRAFALGG